MAELDTDELCAYRQSRWAKDPERQHGKVIEAKSEKWGCLRLIGSVIERGGKVQSLGVWRGGYSDGPGSKRSVAAKPIQWPGTSGLPRDQPGYCRPNEAADSSGTRQSPYEIHWAI